MTMFIKVRSRNFQHSIFEGVQAHTYSVKVFVALVGKFIKSLIVSGLETSL